MVIQMISNDTYFISKFRALKTISPSLSSLSVSSGVAVCGGVSRLYQLLAVLDDANKCDVDVWLLHD